MRIDIDRILLRPAVMSDVEILYKWRNDPQTRAASHNQDEIDFDSHRKWFEKSLKDIDRKIYIAETGNIPVGTVRSDNKKGVSELSWTVNPEYRGQGIGRQMVSLLAKQIKGPIRAEVKAGNLASSRIAEACGMEIQTRKDGILYYFRGEQISENSSPDRN